MSWTAGRFRPPRLEKPLCITDGQRCISFDTPADMVNFLGKYPHVAERIAEFSWWLGEPSGGN